MVITIFTLLACSVSHVMGYMLFLPYFLRKDMLMTGGTNQASWCAHA